MSLVQYDEDFDEKVIAGAEALLKQRNSSSATCTQNELLTATSEARIVLLAAMTVMANKKS